MNKLGPVLHKISLIDQFIEQPQSMLDNNAVYGGN